jgi:hypothetical protein
MDVIAIADQIAKRARAASDNGMADEVIRAHIHDALTDGEALMRRLGWNEGAIRILMTDLDVAITSRLASDRSQ